MSRIKMRHLMLLSAMLLLLIFPNTASAFSDVSPNDWFYEDVNSLKGRGVIDGYPDNTFKPTLSVTHGESLKVISVLKGWETKEDNTYDPFGPIKYQNHWAKKYIKLAADNDILESDNFSLEYDNPATRLEIARYVLKTVNKNIENKLPLDINIGENSKSEFTDAYGDGLSYLYKNNIIKGIPVLNGNTAFQGSRTITRAEFVAMIDRMEDHIEGYKEELEEKEKQEKEKKKKRRPSRPEPTPAPEITPEPEVTEFEISFDMGPEGYLPFREVDTWIENVSDLVLNINFVRYTEDRNAVKSIKITTSENAEWDNLIKDFPEPEAYPGYIFTGWSDIMPDKIEEDIYIEALYELEPEPEYISFEYINHGNHIEITKYVGHEVDVEIPAEIEGLPVTTIGEWAFAYNTLNALTLPNTIIEIKDYAFYDGSIPELVLGYNVINIGMGSFYQNNISSLIIPDSVEYIGHTAFYGNNISSLVLGNSLSTIDMGAFANNNITELNLPNIPLNIKDWAFEYNYLTSLNIPENISFTATDIFNYNGMQQISGSIPTEGSITGEWILVDDLYWELYNAIEEPTEPETTLYTVEFYNWDSTLLDTQEIEEGMDATAPADPFRDGYTFTGWDTNFVNVNSGLTITAIYEEVVVVPEITEVATFSAITVIAGDEITLPGMVEITYSDETTDMVGVVWNDSEFDLTVPGEYTLTGTIEETELTASIIIIVEEKVLIETTLYTGVIEAAYRDTIEINTTGVITEYRFDSDIVIYDEFGNVIASRDLETGRSIEFEVVNGTDFITEINMLP